MQITVDDLSKVKKKINFEIPSARVDEEIVRVYEKIKKKAAIKGFRKGKVPRAYIEKYYQEQMEADVVQSLINDTYFKALLELKIYPVSHPVIESDDLRKGMPLTYSATVEVFPEVTVKDYEGLEIKKQKYVFSDDVINARLAEMQESVAHMLPVEDRPAVRGDSVTLDFAGAIDGVPFDNGSAENFVLELGSGQFIPGFEEQVEGTSVGEEKEVRVTFPENYGSTDLAGKEAVFAITVKEIKTKELPPLDDEFAKEFGEFDTLDQLRAKMTEFHEKREKEKIDADVREQVVKALVEKNDLEIPDVLIDRQLDSMLENTKKRLAQQNASLEMMGLDDVQYRARFRDVAETQVKGALLLEALAGQESIKAEEADLDEKYRQISEQSGQPVDRIKTFYDQNVKARENLSAQVREDKVIDFLLSRAAITEVSSQE